MKYLLLVLRAIVRGLALAVGTDSATGDDAPPRKRWSRMERSVALGYDRLEDVLRQLARG